MVDAFRLKPVLRTTGGSVMAALAQDTVSGAEAKKPAREGIVLNLVLTALALISLAGAGWAVAVSQFRGGIDDLFLVLVCLLLALIASIHPVMWAYENGYLNFLFGVTDEAEPAAAGAGEHAGETHHFAGSTKLFVTVWLALLGLTAIEVFLAYEKVNITLMLIILMGASIMKAALIMAYFMHLRFERMSLILTLVPAMVVCISLLAIFFPDSFRLFSLRQLLR
jgi:cytochrome c oxidase subunit 4